MTPNKAIEIVDGLKPNSYSEEDKLRWINELDSIVKRLVYQWDEKYKAEMKAQYEKEKITEEEYKAFLDSLKDYSYPDDMDTELLIPSPFDDCYTLFLEAKIDYYNREYANYNNSAMMFDSQYSEYKKAYIREHPARG